MLWERALQLAPEEPFEPALCPSKAVGQSPSGYEQRPHGLHKPPHAPQPAQEGRERPAKPKDTQGEAISRALIKQALMK